MRTIWYGKVGGVTGPAPRMIPNNIPLDDFVGLFSPPRLAPLLKARGFRSEVSVDLLEQRRPRVVFMSAPCTVLSRLMNINIGRMDLGKWQAKLSTCRGLLNYSTLHAKVLLSKDGIRPKRSYVHI